MFYLSTIGVVLNVVLIFVNKNNIYDYIRAISLLIFSSFFLFTMRYFKKKEGNKRK